MQFSTIPENYDDTHYRGEATFIIDNINKC